MSAPLLNQTTLNQATRATSQAVDAILEVVSLLPGAEVTNEAPDPQMLRAAADDANEHAQRAFKTLRAAGGQAEGIPPRQPTPLHLLSTPASRRLLRTLRAAVDAAEDVDAERGHVLPDDFPLQPGESRGTGWAETLSELVLRLSIEVEGPRGRE
jgi:hypothetical protein